MKTAFASIALATLALTASLSTALADPPGLKTLAIGA